MTAPHSLSFEAFWSRADTAAALAFFKSKPADRTLALGQALAGQVRQAVGEMLARRMGAGQLAPIPHLGNRDLPWARAWNAALAEGQERGQVDPQHASFLGRPFSGTILAHLNTASRSGTPVNTAHAALVDRVDAGHFAWLDLNFEQVCGLTGTPLFLEAQQWQLRLGTVGPALDAAFVPLTADAPAPALHHLAVPVPSGELWIGPWPDLAPLLETLVKVSPEFPRTAAAQLARADRLLAELGAGEIFVGQGPVLLQAQGDRWVLDRPSPHQEASFYVDHATLLVVDPTVLTDHLAARMGRAEAERALAEHQAEAHRPFRALKVPAGTCHVYATALFAGSPAVFQERLRGTDVDLADLTAPMVLLAPQPLTWAPEPVVSPTLARRRPSPH
jgi:hypothetical protein